MEKNENGISKDRFSERGVLYIVLSIVALILYVFLFGAEEVLFDELEEKDPQWVCWWIFAVGAFCFGSIAGYYRKLWSRDFVVVGASIMAMSFFRFQYNFCSEPEMMIFIFCVNIITVGLIYLGRKPFKETWIGLLPVFLGILYIFVSQGYVVICAAVISLVLLSVVSYKRASVVGKWVFAVGVVVFYLGVTFVYVPLNPFLMSGNVEDVKINPYQRYNNSRLVVRDNSKYHIIDGLTGDSVVHAEFELYENLVIGDRSGVGFKLDFTNTYSEFYDMIGSKITSFPVMIKDSCVYFTTDISVYKELETICSAAPADTAQAILKIKHHTAKLFYDYIAMFQNKDSVAYEKLSKRHKSLYDTILAAVTDARLLNDIDVRIDERLRIYTQYLTLGMLNAVSMDMLKNRDYANLASVFSQQFYMTFFDDEVIYRRVNTTANFTVDIDTVKKTYIVTDKDLKEDYEYEKMKDAFNAYSSFALKYIGLNADFVKELIMGMEGATVNYFKDEEAWNKYMLTFNRALEIRKEYLMTKNIYNYCDTLLRHWVVCIKDEHASDLNSFYLNRWAEVSLIILNSNIKSHADSILAHYKTKLNAPVDSVANAIEQIKSETSQRYEVIQGLYKEVKSQYDFLKAVVKHLNNTMNPNDTLLQKLNSVNARTDSVFNSLNKFR